MPQIHELATGAWELRKAADIVRTQQDLSDPVWVSIADLLEAAADTWGRIYLDTSADRADRAVRRALNVARAILADQPAVTA